MTYRDLTEKYVRFRHEQKKWNVFTLDFDDPKHKALHFPIEVSSTFRELTSDTIKIKEKCKLFFILPVSF